MNDKRKVSTDALETLGMLINDTEKRDAIHLAVEPVTAMQKLYPGQDVGLVEGGAGVCDKPLGIVDPFLKNPVYPGQRFWLVVYPRQIQSLRHVWTHPDFPEENFNKTLGDSEAWLSGLAEELNIPYEELLAGAHDFITSGDYLTGGVEFEAFGSTPSEFWVHYQNVTGKQVPKEKQENFFSCSC